MMNIGVLQFLLAKGIGDVSIKKAIAYIEENKITWEELCLSKEILCDKLRFREELVNNIQNAYESARNLYEELMQSNVTILIENDIRYPQQLKKSLGKKCPPILFAKGNIDLLNNSAVGFCGSRKVSSKGITITENCALQLAEKNVTVVSGYAAGTDIAAHRSALANNGSTVFVLAEGILRMSDKDNISALLNSENHVFVSQFSPKATWNAGNAMKRNGVIIGLSKAMILVESGNQGGTFAAGKEALQVGCPLFVIEFKNPEVSAEANDYFISMGGRPIRGRNLIPNLNEVFSVISSNVDENKQTKTVVDSNYTQLQLNI